jgi:hypothetical protein
MMKGQVASLSKKLNKEIKLERNKAERTYFGEGILRFQSFKLFILLLVYATHCFRKIIIIIININGSTALLLGIVRFFSFLTLYTVGRTLKLGNSPSQGLYLHAEQHKETSMPTVGFPMRDSERL